MDVPSDNPHYRLRRVWFTDAVYADYCYGFANDGLWPLCHRAFVKPVFRATDLDAYWPANARCADAVCEEAADDAPVVLVQDYHFGFAPAMLRQQMPLSTIVTFWHVPWPEAQRFSILAPYIEVRSRVRAAAERINRTCGSGEHCPIILLEGHHPQPRGVALPPRRRSVHGRQSS